MTFPARIRAMGAVWPLSFLARQELILNLKKVARRITYGININLTGVGPRPVHQRLCTTGRSGVLTPAVCYILSS